MALSAGTRLGPYQIAYQLGAGGMGEVYRATDTRLDRTVAIKVLPEHLADDPQRRERFEREAKAVSSLNHPHICTLHDIGEQDGIHYLVMEYLDGHTLQRRLENGRLPLDEALEYAIQIADALDKAHRQGVVHRDLKPGNIMLTKSGTKLLDFGLAKLKGDTAEVSPLSQMSTQDASRPLTAEGTILGTLQYMAPEQLESKEADARTDIFAFGAVVYEMVTGKKAFEGTSQASLIGSILKDDPQPMDELEESTPHTLDRVVRASLSKDLDDRWQTASDVMRELKWIAEDTQRSTTLQASEAVRRRPWSAWSVVAVLALLVFIFGSDAISLLIDNVGTTLVRPENRGGGGSILQLTDNPSVEAWPSFSPDGRSVVYASNASGDWDIYLQRVGGRNAINLTEDSDANDDSPVLSPDGERIAFHSIRSGVEGIFLMGATGESVRRLTGDEGSNPAWSPDSSRIVYGKGAGAAIAFNPESRAGRNAELWIVDLEQEESQLLETGRDSVQPSWSPNGYRIAF